jgi:uncharacterized membrane protein
MIIAVLILPLVNIATLLLSAIPAAAELEICNKTGYPVDVAIGYNERNRWVSKGWWNIAGGRCAVVVGGDLKDRYYYYYAEHRQVGGKWAGNYPFCVSRNTFTIVDDKNCESRGYEKQGFKRIDTGNSKSWRRNLTDAG